MKNSTIGTYGIIALAAVVLVVVAFSRNAAVEAVYPMERVALMLKRGVWPRIKGAFNGPGYAAENERLRREVELLSMMSGELERLECENASLRASLGYSARQGEQWIVAPVVSDHGGAFGRPHVIRVGRGAADGVIDGAIVAVPAGLVGQVSAVTEHTSEIVLLTDPSVKVACSIELADRRYASGILAGGTGEKLVLTHIRGLAKDAPKARVVTSGRGGVFPKGFDVGVLSGARATESGEWYGEVDPGVDFGGLEDVFISRER